MIHVAWLIPAIPAVAFPLIAFFGKRTPGRGAPIGIVAVAVSFVMSLILAGHWMTGKLMDYCVAVFQRAATLVG